MQQKKPINIRVGANIQWLREERHYTQEALSELLGVTPNHLSAIERGVSGISLELMAKLCEVLQVSADHILFGHSDAEMNQAEFAVLVRGICQTQLQIIETMQTISKDLKGLKNV